MNPWPAQSFLQQRFNAAALTAALGHLPDVHDERKSRVYSPKHEHRTHPSFPTTPSPVLETTTLFEKFDIDTLFFIFYYQQVRTGGRTAPEGPPRARPHHTAAPARNRKQTSPHPPARRSLAPPSFQNTYAQYLAARELKRHAWRFNKMYHTWFIRGDDVQPRIVTADGERGSFSYFDYEGGWMQRVKRDFMFDFAHLEVD
jgi:CCR4-NOT transcription complex subunit 3